MTFTDLKEHIQKAGGKVENLPDEEGILVNGGLYLCPAQAGRVALFSHLVVADPVLGHRKPMCFLEGKHLATLVRKMNWRTIGKGSAS